MGKWPKSIRAWRTALLPVHVDAPGAGRINVAGTIREGSGIGFDTPRVFGQWAFVYVVSGRGVYSDVLGTERTMRPGDWIMVFPELGHRYGPGLLGGWSEFYVTFDGPLFELYRENGSFGHDHATGHFMDPKPGWQRIKRLLSELTSMPPHAALARWLVFLLETCTGELGNKPQLVDPRLDKACRLIESGVYNPDPQWDAICREAGVGYENLRKLFSKHLHTSPARFREQCRMQKAVILAQSQKLPAKKVAELLGYYDEAHFSKAFRRATGETFTHYSRMGRYGP